MPSRYRCTHCELNLVIGGFHGGSTDMLWIVGFACPDCGVQHYLETPMFDPDAPLDEIGPDSPPRAPYVPKVATLRGPKGQQTLRCDSSGCPEPFQCQQCGAEGTWGLQGPFSNRHEAEAKPNKPFAEMTLEEIEETIRLASQPPAPTPCPRCKTSSLLYLEDFIT